MFSTSTHVPPPGVGMLSLPFARKSLPSMNVNVKSNEMSTFGSLGEFGSGVNVHVSIADQFVTPAAGVVGNVQISCHICRPLMAVEAAVAPGAPGPGYFKYPLSVCPALFGQVAVDGFGVALTTYCSVL
jgi:hypothetical protein